MNHISSSSFPFLSSIFTFQALNLTLTPTPTPTPNLAIIMDKTTEKETRDFMNVESFSQLPFIRPQASVKEKGIRLFGIEFGGGGGDTTTTTTGEECADSSENEETTFIKENNNNRRFECHYCCRNFPTSQALGGHQNAHKRERQQAKRAHLHSAMVHNSLADAHIYGLMNYSRLTAAAPAPAPPNITYPSWTSASTSNRFYGSGHSSYSHQAPINGSPLGLWRIPPAATAVQSHRASFNRDHSIQHPFPLFGSDQELKTSHMQVGVGGSSSQSRFVYESKPSSQDHLSLDLHL